MPVITRAISVAADGMVLALTLNATWKIYRASQEAGMYSQATTPSIRNTKANTDSQLGTFGRAKKKVDELQRVIAESRRAGH